MGSPSDRVRCGFGAPWLSKKPAILGTNHGSTLFDPCKRPPGHRRRVARPANHARFADHVPSAALTERSGLVQHIGRAETWRPNLGFILVQSELCRSTIRDLAARCGAAVDEGLVYRTQVSGDDKSFPDVEGGPAGGDPQVILEGKFSAGLTDNQPRTYLRRLMPRADGILLFVVPARRFVALWPEVRARCSDDGIEAHDGVDEKELRAARTSSGHIIAMISWRELLGRMSGAVAAGGEAESERTSPSWLVFVISKILVSSHRYFVRS